MTPVSGRSLLGQAVRWRGMRFGTVRDLLLDPQGRRALGLEVGCEDGEERFLPLAALEGGPRGLELTSPLALLDASALAFYRERGRSLVALTRGAAGGSPADVLVDPQGALEPVLDEPGETRRAPSGSGAPGPRDGVSRRRTRGN